MRRTGAGDEERRRSARRINRCPSKRSRQQLSFNERSASIMVPFLRETRAASSIPSRRKNGRDRRRRQIVVGFDSLVHPRTCWHPGSRNPRTLYGNLRRAPRSAMDKYEKAYAIPFVHRGGQRESIGWRRRLELTDAGLGAPGRYPGRRSSGASSSLRP